LKVHLPKGWSEADFKIKRFPAGRRDMADEQMVRIELIARDGLSPHVAWVEIPHFQGEAPAAVLWGDRVFLRCAGSVELRDGDVYRECLAVTAARPTEEAAPEQRS
jgi:hypothetical protein